MKHVSYVCVLINNLLFDENVTDCELNISTMLEITRNVCLEILTKLNSVALVRKRTIPTERPPPVGEVSANFFG